MVNAVSKKRIKKDPLSSSLYKNKAVYLSTLLPLSLSLYTQHMEFVFFKHHVLLGLVIWATLLPSPCICIGPCSFPAIFNFGDSNSDTGGLSAAFGQAPYPNGETYFHVPSGRFSDGRLVIDFIGTASATSSVCQL